MSGSLRTLVICLGESYWPSSVKSWTYGPFLMNYFKSWAYDIDPKAQLLGHGQNLPNMNRSASGASSTTIQGIWMLAQQWTLSPAACYDVSCEIVGGRQAGGWSAQQPSWLLCSANAASKRDRGSISRTQQPGGNPSSVHQRRTAFKHHQTVNGSAAQPSSFTVQHGPWT